MSCYYYDEETPEFYAVSNPAARKAHNCCECGDVISPREKYRAIKGLWGGDFCTYKQCSACAEIYDSLGCKPPFEGLRGTIRQADWECALPLSALDDLSPRAAIRLAGWIED